MRTLFDPPRIEPARKNNPDGLDLRAEAQRWIDENPDLYRLFEHFALRMASLERPFGAKFLAERVRWECAETNRDGEYAINNNLTAYIARRLVQDHPHLSRFLRFRETRY